MFKLKYLIATASFAYILVISAGVVGLRYFVSLPELRQTTNWVNEFEFQTVSAQLLAQENQLLHALDQIDTSSNTSQSLSVNNKRVMFFSGNLTQLENWLENTNNLKPEIIDDFMTLAHNPSKSYVSYLKMEGKLYQLGIEENSKGFGLVIAQLRSNWLHNLTHHSLNNLTIQDLQRPDHTPTSYLPLMDAQGQVITYIKLQHELAEPRLFDIQTIVGLLSLLALPLLITLLVMVVFVRPMTQIVSNIKHRQQNSLDMKIDDSQYIFELKAFAQAFNELLFQQARQQELLKLEALTDQLTGIPNRRAFDQAVDHDWRFAMRANIALTVIIADIDHFKNFNDVYGHQEGDKALTAVALALKSCCRRANEFVARYGGEEFGLILQADQNPELFLSAANQAVRRLNIEHCQSSCSDILTISIGACTLNPSTLKHPLTPQHVVRMLKQADEALYESKESGRNRFLHVHFDENRT